LLEITCSFVHTDYRMQRSVNKQQRDAEGGGRTLTDLKQGETGVLDRIDLPEDGAQRLMELGFLPGHSITRAHSAPGGDPRVFQVDGSEVALRRETAVHLILR
jgi:ferrous iron transport protein A